ncbi:ParB/RepB/Spo0J family partition protein [Janibacter terrae]|uniref:ParB/RepB/Spo0J family partition protein n=1 Tax=Janibacter terrae TaxID=103817 RepID=UPI0031F9EEF4
MTTTDTQVARIRVDQIRAHGTNVRKDLGDLRDLCDSVQRFGIMQPITVEKRADHWLLRDGHRRVAVATMLGLDRIPAVIHGEHLDDDEWLTHAVHHNQRRRQMDKADRAHAVHKMREAGMSWDGIAREFGVSASAVQKWISPRERDRSRDKAVRLTALTSWLAAWTDAVEQGQAAPGDVIDALRGLVATGTVTEHLPMRDAAP